MVCFLYFLIDVFMEEVFFKERIVIIVKSIYIYCIVVWYDLRNEFVLEIEVFEKIFFGVQYFYSNYFLKQLFV